jgi:hypothetical protein
MVHGPRKLYRDITVFPRRWRREWRWYVVRIAGNGHTLEELLAKLLAHPTTLLADTE